MDTEQALETIPEIEEDQFSLLHSALEEISNERKANHETLSDPAQEQAQVYKGSLIKMFKVEGKLGENILKGLWDIYSTGLIMFDTSSGRTWNPNQFEEWFDENLLDFASSAIYATSLSRVVSRIFQDVHAKSLTKQAYIVAGERLTVDTLLNKSGLVDKLTRSSSTYALPTVTDEQRNELLVKITSGTKRQVSAHINAITKGGPIELPYYITYTGIGQASRKTYVFPDLDFDQSKLMEIRLGNVWKPTFGAKV